MNELRTVRSSDAHPSHMGQGRNDTYTHPESSQDALSSKYGGKYISSIDSISRLPKHLAMIAH